ncbi:hypothetical protein D9619_013091 [Psilocybe cf. subviscida]|uniref:Histone deacetylase interacting domain-containing protein n=1 Tax=Psilocybe cf. subviscida TaxID=2480587 RepID=A0A8H5AZE3_9AGAR|nr:hypothetical protein D9619_013091 [Psilocybe cf. subviscida]
MKGYSLRSIKPQEAATIGLAPRMAGVLYPQLVDREPTPVDEIDIIVAHGATKHKPETLKESTPIPAPSEWSSTRRDSPVDPQTPLDRPLKVTDALTYLDTVKVQFQDQPDVYNHFLDTMKEFKSEQIDTPGVIQRVSHLFNDHPALIQGFNTFLPVGYRIECSTDPYDAGFITVTTPSGGTKTSSSGGALAWSTGPPTAPESVSSPAPMDPRNYGVDGQAMEPEKIKQCHNADTYRQFLDILSRYFHSSDIDEEDLSKQIAILFKDDPYLRNNFGVSILDRSQPIADAGPYQQFYHVLSRYRHIPNIDERGVWKKVAIFYNDDPDFLHDFQSLFIPDLSHYRELNTSDALSYLDAIKLQCQDQLDVYNQFLEIMKDFKAESIDTPGVIQRVSHLFNGYPALIQGFNTFLPIGYRIECSTDPYEAGSNVATTPSGETSGSRPASTRSTGPPTAPEPVTHPGSTSQSSGTWTFDHENGQWRPAEAAHEDPPLASPSSRVQSQGLDLEAFPMDLTDLEEPYPSPHSWPIVRPGHGDQPSAGMFTNAQVKIFGGTFVNVAHTYQCDSPALGGGPGFPIMVLGLQAVLLATRSHYPHCNHQYNPQPLLVADTASTVNGDMALCFPLLYRELKTTIAPLALWFFIKMWIQRNHRQALL